MAPRILLLDVDGTLVDRRGRLPASAAAAVRGARAAGHRVYLCTGRSRPEVYDELWDLGIDGLIGGNGSYVEVGGAVIHAQVLPEEATHRAVEWLVARHLGFYLECNSGLYANDVFPEKAAVVLGGPTPENIDAVRALFPHMVYGAGGVDSGRDDVNKISFVLEPQVDLAALAREFDGVARIDTWSVSGVRPEFGEIGQLGVHKGAAVRLLAEHLGVAPGDMIGFGDARSDMELLTVCGTGVAMGDAPDELKDIADLITDDADHDGLARAFATLGLLGGWPARDRPPSASA